MNNNQRIKKETVLKYQGNYNSKSFWNKIRNYGQRIGIDGAKKAISMVILLTRKDVPLKVKSLIGGALGYLILSFDITPDIIPIFGFADDLAVISIAFKEAKPYIDGNTKSKVNSVLRRFLK